MPDSSVVEHNAVEPTSSAARAEPCTAWGALSMRAARNRQSGARLRRYTAPIAQMGRAARNQQAGMGGSVCEQSRPAIAARRDWWGEGVGESPEG
eukprot:6188560-Pleurochrysis_carterae.AAC.1